MTPYHADPWLTVYQGDCREVMAAMEPGSVHCVVTSPPYWGLRDYGTATWVGGDEGCDHKGPPKASESSGLNHRAGRSTYELAATVPFVGSCGKCGAIREDSQLGLEPTPEEYVANMVAVFREVRRVLRDDGTVWLNLGDSYAAGGSRQNGYHDGRTNRDKRAAAPFVEGLKPKDLVGVPWRVAFALQADGWYLRSDIIWSKPNPMPESVTDRPTKAHEYVFLLSKSPRYWYDAEAVREPHQEPERSGTPERRLMAKGTDGHHATFGGWDYNMRLYNPAGRNLRSVLSIATQPYPGAHFATFPEKLVEPCIKAGCPDRVCSECGAGWERRVERQSAPAEVFTKARRGPDSMTHASVTNDGRGSGSRYQKWLDAHPPQTTGWSAPCDHDAPTRPGVVLDPFAGSGTTGRVAQRLSRRAVLIDLNAEYLVQAMERNRDMPLGLETA